jgi:hypothetical protein
VNLAANDAADMEAWMTTFQKALAALAKPGRERDAVTQFLN